VKLGQFVAASVKAIATFKRLGADKLLHVPKDTLERVRVQNDKESTNMKTVRVAFVVSALALLGGCMVVPVAPAPYAGPPGYYAPAPAYYAPPVYVAPSFGFGFYGGGRGYGRGHGHR